MVACHRKAWNRCQIACHQAVGGESSGESNRIRVVVEYRGLKRTNDCLGCTNRVNTKQFVDNKVSSGCFVRSCW